MMMLNLIGRIDRLVKKTLTAFCAVFLLLMVVFAVYNVVMRYVFENPPVWGDLLTVLSNIWLVFLALALLLMRVNCLTYQGVIGLHQRLCELKCIWLNVQLG